MRMTNSSSYDKGVALEQAVRAIEEAVLRSSPGLLPTAIRIEGNKVVVVAGVRHEIDLYVVVEAARGYESTFIFECKNWTSPVGKNEIIVLSEKVRALAVQRGFIVAPQFTRHAEAQASLDPRIELLTATVLDPNLVRVPARFHSIGTGQSHAHVMFNMDLPETELRARQVDLAAATLVVDGVRMDTEPFVQRLIAEARDSALGRFSSAFADEGTHKVPFQTIREVTPGSMTIDGLPVRSIALTGTVDVQINKAVVIAAYDIETRGRHITVQISIPNAVITGTFVQIPTSRLIPPSA